MRKGNFDPLRQSQQNWRFLERMTREIAREITQGIAWQIHRRLLLTPIVHNPVIQIGSAQV